MVGRLDSFLEYVGTSWQMRTVSFRGWVRQILYLSSLHQHPTSTNHITRFALISVSNGGGSTDTFEGMVGTPAASGAPGGKNPIGKSSPQGVFFFEEMMKNTIGILHILPILHIIYPKVLREPLREGVTSYVPFQGSQLGCSR